MKKLLVLLGIGILLFYISPVFFKMIGIETLGLMVIALLVLYPLYSLVAGFIAPKWRLVFPLCIGLLFIPAIYLFYNESAWVYPIRYTMIAYLGAGLSYIKKEEAFSHNASSFSLSLMSFSIESSLLCCD